VRRLDGRVFGRLVRKAPSGGDRRVLHKRITYLPFAAGVAKFLPVALKPMSGGELLHASDRGLDPHDVPLFTDRQEARHGLPAERNSEPLSALDTIQQVRQVSLGLECTNGVHLTSPQLE